MAAYRAPEIESGPVDAVNGAFMLMRRAPFDELGGFDQGYWMYMEDLDLCYRFAQRGWRTLYEPRATVTHVKGGTTGGARSPRLVWHFHRGMCRFYRDHYAAGAPAAERALVYAGIAARLVAALAYSGLRRSRARLRQRLRSVATSDGGRASTPGPG